MSTRRGESRSRNTASGTGQRPWSRESWRGRQRCIRLCRCSGSRKADCSRCDPYYSLLDDYSSPAECACRHQHAPPKPTRRREQPRHLAAACRSGATWFGRSRRA
eukprot:Amastigsp_a341620_254.p2 type:complete len:105 gc:universal Amastigsp_a341620_254:254-568(+)